MSGTQAIIAKSLHLLKLNTYCVALSLTQWKRITSGNTPQSIMEVAVLFFGGCQGDA